MSPFRVDPVTVLHRCSPPFHVLVHFLVLRILPGLFFSLEGVPIDKSASPFFEKRVPPLP